MIRSSHVGPDPVQWLAKKRAASAARLREATEITSELHRAYALLHKRRSVR